MPQICCMPPIIFFSFFLQITPMLIWQQRIYSHYYILKVAVVVALAISAFLWHNHQQLLSSDFLKCFRCNIFFFLFLQLPDFLGFNTLELPYEVTWLLLNALKPWRKFKWFPSKCAAASVATACCWRCLSLHAPPMLRWRCRCHCHLRCSYTSRKHYWILLCCCSVLTDSEFQALSGSKQISIKFHS